MIFLMGYHKIAIKKVSSESKKATIIAMTPPPSPGPKYNKEAKSIIQLIFNPKVGIIKKGRFKLAFLCY